MRYSGSVLIGGLLVLGLLSHGLVLAQLSHNPERGYRDPPETFRADRPGGSDADLLRLSAADGIDLIDPRAW